MDKMKPGRPPLPPERRRSFVGVRLPPELVAWMDAQGTRTVVIETALKKLKESKQ